MPEDPSTEPAFENNRIDKMKTTYHYKMPRHPLHRFHHMDFQNLGNSCSIKWYPAGYSIVPRHPHFIEGAFRGYQNNTCTGILQMKMIISGMSRFAIPYFWSVYVPFPPKKHFYRSKAINMHLWKSEICLSRFKSITIRVSSFSNKG